jgi:hypothetical protein
VGRIPASKLQRPAGACHHWLALQPSCCLLFHPNAILTRCSDNTLLLPNTWLCLHCCQRKVQVQLLKSMRYPGPQQEPVWRQLEGSGRWVQRAAPGQLTGALGVGEGSDAGMLALLRQQRQGVCLPCVKLCITIVSSLSLLASLLTCVPRNGGCVRNSIPAGPSTTELG